MSSSPQTPEPSYRVAARFFVSGLPIALVDGAKLTVTALTVMQIGHAASSATPLAAATLGVETLLQVAELLAQLPERLLPLGLATVEARRGVGRPRGPVAA